MKTTITIECTPEQLRNIVQGLDLMHSRCMDHSAALQTSEAKYTDLKQYFREKQIEVHQQIKQFNELLIK